MEAVILLLFFQICLDNVLKMKESNRVMESDKSGKGSSAGSRSHVFLITHGFFLINSHKMGVFHFEEPGKNLVIRFT